MRRILNALAPSVLLALGPGYCAFGLSVLLGGPTKTAIVDATRKTMISAAVGEADAESARTAGIGSKRICNKDAARFACIVGLSVAGAPKAFVSVLTNGADGAWMAVE